MAMSNVHFNIFEDNKENSRSQNALVNKTKECKLKTISGNENQEVKCEEIYFLFIFIIYSFKSRLESKSEGAHNRGILEG